MCVYLKACIYRIRWRSATRLPVCKLPPGHISLSPRKQLSHQILQQLSIPCLPLSPSGPER